MARSRGRIRMHKPCNGSAPPRTHTMGFSNVDSHPRCSQRTTRSICGVRWMGWNDRRCWFDLGHHPMGIANRRNGFISRVRVCQNWLACGDHCRAWHGGSLPKGLPPSHLADAPRPRQRIFRCHALARRHHRIHFRRCRRGLPHHVSNHQCRSILVEVAMQRTSRQGPWRGRLRGIQRKHRLRRRHDLGGHRWRSFEGVALA